jgi:hypothetical protein
LTPVVLAPLSLQEGALMTAACPNRFHDFRVGADRDTVTDVLLCAGVSVTGPGTIYRLRFHASSTEQTTGVHLLPGLRFFDAGILVTSSGSDAVVTIGSAVGVTNPGTPATRLALAPNPARGRGLGADRRRARRRPGAAGHRRAGTPGARARERLVSRRRARPDLGRHRAGRRPRRAGLLLDRAARRGPLGPARCVLL